jgi:hypothetical protein
MLYSDFLPPNSMRFVPVKLRQAYRIIGQSDFREPFSFSPTTGTVTLS